MEDFIVSTVYDGKQRKLFLKQCLFCNKDHYSPKHVHRKCCSRECSDRLREAKKIDLVCDNCGIGFVRTKAYLKKSKSGLRFCSRKCKDEAQRMGNHNEILRPSHYKDGRYSYREIARRHHPNICNRCGYDEYVRILRVHHRDRNRENNHPDNLEVLCPNCHEVEHLLSGDGIYTRNRKKTFGPSTEVETRPASESR